MQKLKRNGYVMRRVVRILKAEGPLPISGILNRWDAYPMPTRNPHSKGRSTRPTSKTLANVMKFHPLINREYDSNWRNKCYIYEAIE